MSVSSFSILDLVPDFSLVLPGAAGQSADVLSAWFVVILIVIFFLFTVYTTVKYFRARRHVRFFTALLVDASLETLVDQRRNILNHCKEDKQQKEHYHLWREFDESLVEFQVGGQRRLGNTLDAAFFFNGSTLSRSLTENRMISAVPGFLTAIGVIGTFAGLQMGLASLELGSDAGVETIREGIGAVIAGASIAFLTSVWGVFLSVLFNFGEKLLERRIRLSIGQLQTRIDELFPRYTAESALVQILSSNKESQDTLKGLAEQIGEKMQEALVQTSDTINKGLEDALNRIMAPAIESLVGNANKGSEEALGTLMARFMEGMGNVGEHQRKALDAASDNVKMSVESMSTQMFDFIGQLEQQAQKTAQLEVEHGERLQQKFDQVMSSATGSIDKVVASTQEQIQQIQVRDEARQQHFLSGVDQAAERHTVLSGRISELSQTQLRANEQITEELQELATSFSLLIDGNNKAANAILKSSGEMNASSNQLGLLSANVKEASGVLAGEISKSVISTHELSARNEEMSGLLVKSMEGINLINSASQTLVSSLSQASELMNSSVSGMDAHLKSVMVTMGQHLNDLRTSMAKHLEEINQQVAHLLNEYAGQVNTQTQERLNEWNKQTMAYTGSMTSAINAIGSIVEEIASKTQA